MTIIDERDLAGWLAASPRRVRWGHQHRSAPGPHRGSTRPGVAPLSYRGTGLVVSAAPHRRVPERKVSAPVTVALAGLVGLITVLLGLVAPAGAEGGAPTAEASEQLAVVYVQDGETLQGLASRVAPESPVDQVVDRIRVLNELDSTVVAAGRSLIAPIN